MEAFKSIALANKWNMIWPELSLALLALLLLILDLLLPPNKRSFVPLLAVIGQAIVLLFVLYSQMPVGAVLNFSGMLIHTPLGYIMRIFFLIVSLLVSYLSYLYLAKQKLPKVEFFHIILVATPALMFLVQSHHFVMLFIALETFTVGLFVLVSYCRTSEYSLEAGLKYLIMSALSSAILLFGVVLLYGMAGNPTLANFTPDGMDFGRLGNFIDANADNVIAKMGVLFVICGIAFKMGVVPFQIWIPDVYQGAPTPVTAFLAVASKAAAFIVLINLVKGPFVAMEDFLKPLLSAIAVITILFGNITALSQSNVKRLMGLSGIAHAGYMLVGVVASFSITWAIPAVIFYLFTYLLGSFSVFCVMGHLAGSDDEDQQMQDYECLAKNNPFLAGVLAIGLGSLAGIPPLVGFIGKLLIFIAAFQAGLYILLGASVVGVVISIYYYFGWMRDAFFHILQPEFGEGKEAFKDSVSLHVGHRCILMVLAGVTVIFGLYQGILVPFIF